MKVLQVVKSVGGVAVMITALLVIMSFIFPAVTQWAMFVAAMTVATFTPVEPSKYLAKVKWLMYVFLVIALLVTHMIDSHLVEVHYPEFDGIGCYLLIYAVVNLLLQVMLSGWLKTKEKKTK